MSGLICLHGKEMHLKFPKFTLRALAESPREVKLPVSWKKHKKKAAMQRKVVYLFLYHPLPSTNWLLWGGPLRSYHSRSNSHNLTQLVLFENITVDLLYHHQWPQYQQQRDELLILCIKRVLCICYYYCMQEKMGMEIKENKRHGQKCRERAKFNCSCIRKLLQGIHYSRILCRHGSSMRGTSGGIF